jgi:5-methylcytosine-specific restriction endonuclease McrA
MSKDGKTLLCNKMIKISDKYTAVKFRPVCASFCKACSGKHITKKKNKRTSSNTFYKSWEWKKVRYEAFLKYGKICSLCGAKPPESILVVDHIKPRNKYPKLELDIKNLQVLCNECNMGKSNIDETDWR